MSTVLRFANRSRAGKTGPLYLLEGDDLQSRHDLAIEFANVVDEGLQAFNVQSFYANEASNAAGRDQLIGSLLSNARTLPMMAPRRVIVVHEADRLLAPKRGKDDDAARSSSRRKKGKRGATTPAEELEAYIEKPEPMTTLVFVSAPLDANRRVVKLLRKHADVVDCGSLHDAARGRDLDHEAPREGRARDRAEGDRLLLDDDGTELGRIRPEVEKLVLYAAGESDITVAHVRDWWCLTRNRRARSR